MRDIKLALEADIKQAKLDLAIIKSEATGAKAEVWKHQETLSEVQAQVVTERGNVEIYQANLVGVQAQVAEVSKRIAPLHAEELELVESIKGARIALQLLESERDAATAEYEKNKVLYDRQLHNIESRAREVSIKTQEDEQSWERSRQDLAVREAKLNEREKALEMRELKVNRDERNLARNSELLNM